MPATHRIEKYGGATLVVQDDWLTIVWEKTGCEVSGPVSNDDEVKRLTALAIPFLRTTEGLRNG